VVIEAYANQISLKRQDVRDASQKKLGEDIPQAIYMKIVKELAYCNLTSWIFKSGNGTE
jgi:hypothetical protein